MKSLERAKRKFPGKVTAMLHGIASITDAAIEHVSGLSEEDTSITPERLRNLRRRIDELRDAIFSADNGGERREMQAAVRKATQMAHKELNSLKVFIETSFLDNEAHSKELLQKLGFRDLYRKAVHLRQNGMMGALLQKVAGNIDGELEASLILAGLPAKRIDAIRELAAGYHSHRTGHEGGLGHQREYTDADIIALNALYIEVMALAKKAKCHFANQPAIFERFVLNNLMAYEGKGKGLPDAGTQTSAA